MTRDVSDLSCLFRRLPKVGKILSSRVAWNSAVAVYAIPNWWAGGRFQGNLKSERRIGLNVRLQAGNMYRLYLLLSETFRCPDIFLGHRGFKRHCDRRFAGRDS